MRLGIRKSIKVFQKEGSNTMGTNQVPRRKKLTESQRKRHEGNQKKQQKRSIDNLHKTFYFPKVHFLLSPFWVETDFNHPKVIICLHSQICRTAPRVLLIMSGKTRSYTLNIRVYRLMAHLQNVTAWSRRKRLSYKSITQKCTTSKPPGVI